MAGVEIHLKNEARFPATKWASAAKAKGTFKAAAEK
jgi:hypothetical protein